jgi:hypothetical protein
LAAKVWVGIRSRAKYLRRLSVVFAVELRLKIVTELYMREMSPKQFHAEFGGGSISRVTHNFEKLAEHDWLRYIRSEGPGGKRRGAKEHFYRATELAFCDADTWAMLPYSIRVAFSWNAFKQIAQRLREAMEGATFDARPDRHLTGTQLLLDQLGWERVIDAVSVEFVSQFEEQEDARRRALHSGEELIRASSILVVFESPTKKRGRTGPRLVENRHEPLVPFPVRLSKVFADDVCLQIIAEANQRKVSAPLFHAEVGGESVEAVRRRFKMLEQIGWLKLVDQKTGGRRRSAIELFYRAAGPAILKDEGPWAEVADSLRRTSAWRTFELLMEQVKEAMVAGTFDGREDRCLAWSILSLDQQGWEKVTVSVEALLVTLYAEQEQAKARMKKSGEKPIIATAALAAFESPLESVKEP